MSATVKDIPDPSVYTAEIPLRLDRSQRPALSRQAHIPGMSVDDLVPFGHAFEEAR